MLNKLTLEVQHTYINATIDDDTEESESLEILLNNCSEVAKHSYIEKAIDNYNLKILSTLINNCPNTIEIKSWHIDKAFENPEIFELLLKHETAQVFNSHINKALEEVFNPHTDRASKGKKILEVLIQNTTTKVESWHISIASENPKLQDMLQIVQATKYMEIVFGPLDIIDEHDFDIALGGTILDHMKLYAYTDLIGNVDDNLDS
ncbi:MAG: hypothetical protein LN566_00735 [Rickettsia endosymbiont of Stiretrus anchorago]|nr:hypothetical protein [Rickettsia endosymbiont of Stiretrus anchorago]